jgi:hypothetical protein
VGEIDDAYTQSVIDVDQLATGERYALAQQQYGPSAHGQLQ